MATQRSGYRPPAPPPLDQLPLVHASAEVAQWLALYWEKLGIPSEVAGRTAVTNDRQEFAQWTGRRLNPMALGCYCYLPNASGDQADVGCGAVPELLNAEAAAGSVAGTSAHLQPPLPGMVAEPEGTPAADSGAAEDDHMPRSSAQPSGDYRHLIFVEPDLLPVSTEVTVAHELIHLFDRVQGQPRKHRCHGYDAISVDESALTERDPEYLRAQLREETVRREAALRRVRPYRYLYVCPQCHREYPRVRRYSRPVSCGRCDSHYNRAFVLALVSAPHAPGGDGMQGAADDEQTRI